MAENHAYGTGRIPFGSKERPGEPPPPEREELPLKGRAMVFLFYTWPFGWLTAEHVLLSQRGLIVEGITDESTGAGLDGYWALAGHLEWAKNIIAQRRIEEVLESG